MKAYQGTSGTIELWTLADTPEEARTKFWDCLKANDLAWATERPEDIQVKEITHEVEYLIV